jgi:hypothetical protein
MRGTALVPKMNAGKWYALAMAAAITSLTMGCSGQSGSQPTAEAESRQVVTGTLLRVGGRRSARPRLLPGRVVARNEAGVEFTAAAGDDGRFQLLLPPGTYLLTGTSPQVSSGRAVGSLSGRPGAVLRVGSSSIGDLQVIIHIR